MKERQKSENQRVLTFKKTTSQVMVTDRREMRQMKNQSVKEQAQKSGRMIFKKKMKD